MTAAVSTPAELFDLSGTRAVVVGGTGVLGGRFCQVLAAAGAQVTVAGRDSSRGEAVVEAIVSSGGGARFLRLDVTERADIEVATRALDAGGGVDIVVNAAGVNSATPFADVDDAEWERLLAVNLTSVYRTCQAFAPQLSRSRHGGSIINVSSASSGPPLSRVMGYGVAKAGVNNLTQYLASELADRSIRVNAIVPGFFPAEQNRALLSPQRVAQILGHTPLGRLGEPHELDGVLLWLASSKASGFVTGSLVRVDGGFLSKTI